MMELPETTTIARQIRETLTGRKILHVIAAHPTQQTTFLSAAVENIPVVLGEKVVDGAHAFGSYVRLNAGRAALLMGDGVTIRYHAPGAEQPARYSAMLEFDDGAALTCSVQTYGALFAYLTDDHENVYYRAAKEMPSPLTDAFDRAWFEALLAGAKPSMNVKAMMAGQQAIPGLGDGCLQDILLLAGVHPKKKLAKLDAAQRDKLYTLIKSVLADMTAKGGRDTEGDLFGRPGGYKALLNKALLKGPCPRCGTPIAKQSFMGGSVCFCPSCQPA